MGVVGVVAVVVIVMAKWMRSLGLLRLPIVAPGFVGVADTPACPRPARCGPVGSTANARAACRCRLNLQPGTRRQRGIQQRRTRRRIDPAPDPRLPQVRVDQPRAPGRVAVPAEHQHHPAAGGQPHVPAVVEGVGRDDAVVVEVRGRRAGSRRLETLPSGARIGLNGGQVIVRDATTSSCHLIGHAFCPMMMNVAVVKQ